MNVAQARRAIERGRDEHHRACRLAPLPAGVSPLEAALQEMLLDRGHRNPLSTAARMADTVLRQRPPAIATSPPLPPGQWSAGTTSRGDGDARLHGVLRAAGHHELAERLRFWRQMGANTYRGVHDALRRQVGPASQFLCVDCGEPAQDWSYQGGSPDEQMGSDGPFSRDPSFYVPRCRGCHKRYDHALHPRTHCRNGHPYDEDNVYRPSADGHRQCLACVRRGMVRRYRAEVGYNPDWRP